MGGMCMDMPSMFGRARGGGGGGGDPFTDPFRLFEQVFADMHDQEDVHDPREHMPDVYGRQSQNSRSGSGGRHTSRQDPFRDPFFGGMGSMMQQGSSRSGGFSSFRSSSFVGSCGSGEHRQSVSTTTRCAYISFSI
mmetsp:Transcript_36870/g.42890  ORF Transcript_36870/g.42890 Transcript_36870/m.42890 type:complete len:136 (+) Transcript_36870:84-491(+)